jgi:hypothetical protein
MDVSAISPMVDTATLSELNKALAGLDVVLWLKKWDLLEYRHVMVEAGYSSHIALCSLSMDEADEVRNTSNQPLQALYSPTPQIFP